MVQMSYKRCPHCGNLIATNALSRHVPVCQKLPDNDELARLYETEKWGYRRIARRYGVSDGTVRRRLAVLGLVQLHEYTSRIIHKSPRAPGGGPTIQNYRNLLSAVFLQAHLDLRHGGSRGRAAVAWLESNTAAGYFQLLDIDPQAALAGLLPQAGLGNRDREYYARNNSNGTGAKWKEHAIS